MDTYNIYANEHEWDFEQEHPGYRHRGLRVGGRLGAVGMGASLYELPPGEGSWPYHYEHASEEWALVVSGRPMLRVPDGEQQLEEGDVVVFPRGPAGAHKLWNATEEPVRVMIFSTKTPVEVVAYPDSGKLGIWTLEQGYIAMVRDEPKLDYWEGE